MIPSRHRYLVIVVIAPPSQQTFTTEHGGGANGRDRRVRHAAE